MKAVVAWLVAALLGSMPAGPRPTDHRVYRPPVSAPVADPFRPPPAPWLPGNRGIEYRTVPGTPVHAIGDGVVVFAGLVAGERDVTVLHPDGLRSSYVDLATIRVALGDAVRGGDPIGLSTQRLHLGVRRGETYLDPASLWGTRPVGHVILIPDDQAILGGSGTGRYHRTSALRPVGRTEHLTPGSHPRSPTAPPEAHTGPGSTEPMGRSGR